ncbi:MAG: restriction endonuclease subunit S, partial [bacterium]
MFENTKNNNLPVGWQQASIENISERIHYGYTASAENRDTGVQLLRITDIQNRNVNWHEVPFCEISEQELAKYELKDGDLVFARTGATVGKSYLIKGKIPKAVFASYLIRIILHNEIDKQFVYYFFQSPSYWQQIGMHALGIGQPNVNATTLSSLTIPLPPLAEQHRIVAKIEELFSDLDAGIASLKQAQAQLKTYRQAVLKYAFEGKLTAAWREQNKPEPAEKLLAQIKAERGRQYQQQLAVWQKAGVENNGKKKPPKPQKPKEFPPLTEAELAELPELPEVWCWVKLGNLSIGVEYGSAKKSKKEGQIPVIRMGNLQNGIIVW